VSFDADLPPSEAGPSRGLLRQVLADGGRVGVAREVLDPATTAQLLTGDALPVESGETVTVEVSVVDPSGREGAPATAVTGPMP
jgi:hypothetical protein